MSDRRHLGVGMTSARTRERLVERLRTQGITNEAVLGRIASVPRHLFVDEALASRAYEDTPLPIGHGQTISQPYIVALMTSALLEQAETAGPLRRVLEVGTGCGYQTAVLAPFVQHVYSVERILPLAQKAKRTLRAIDIQNVSIRYADGWQGWRSQGPFAGILVAAAAAAVPRELLDQLADGGCLIIPVEKGPGQVLARITRQADEYRREELCQVSFVPFIPGMAQ